MYWIISGVLAALALCGLALAARAMRRARVLREQLLAFHAAGAEQDKKICALEAALDTARQDAEKWENAALSARGNAIREVQNLLTYNGSEVGQRDFETE